ncbi:hypothetical protein D3C72_2057240 [compost metagenome]
MRHFCVEWTGATIGRQGAREEIPFADATPSLFLMVGRGASRRVMAEAMAVATLMRQIHISIR